MRSRSGNQDGRILRHLKTYFATTTRVGSAARVATDGEYEFMREAGMFDDDVISGAADAILFERARALLLGGARASL